MPGQGPGCARRYGRTLKAPRMGDGPPRMSGVDEKPKPRTSQADKWAMHLAAAEQFFGREGHLTVPRKHVETITLGGDGGQAQRDVPLKLGTWVDNRRRRATTLSPEWAEQLPKSECGGRDTRALFAVRTGGSTVHQEDRHSVKPSVLARASRCTRSGADFSDGVHDQEGRWLIARSRSRSIGRACWLSSTLMSLTQVAGWYRASMDSV